MRDSARGACAGAALSGARSGSVRCSSTSCEAGFYPIFTDGSGSQVATVSRSESGLSGIVGIAYRLGDAAAVRLDFEWFDMPAGMETSIASLGLTYRFN